MVIHLWLGAGERGTGEKKIKKSIYDRSNTVTTEQILNVMKETLTNIHQSWGTVSSGHWERIWVRSRKYIINNGKRSYTGKNCTYWAGHLPSGRISYMTMKP